MKKYSCTSSFLVALICVCSFTSCEKDLPELPSMEIPSLSMGFCKEKASIGPVDKTLSGQMQRGKAPIGPLDTTTIVNPSGH